MSTTKDLYFSHKENQYLPFRQEEVHEPIISQVMATHFDQQGSRETILVGGGSAAGKSEITKLTIKLYQNENKPYVHVDCDLIKELIPEYIEMQESGDEDQILKSAELVHDESSDIAERILFLCMALGMNVIYEGTMKNAEKYKRYIKNFRYWHYTVEAIIVDVPLEVAIQRSADRFDLTGRNVPIEEIEESHQRVSAAFQELEPLFDRYVMYDNTDEPKVFAHKTEESLDKDPIRLEEFFKKALIPNKGMELSDKKPTG